MCCTVRCDHRLHDPATVLRETVVYLLVPTLAHRVPVLHLVRGRVGSRAGVRLRLRLRLWLRLQVRVRFQLRVRVGARARARARVRVGRVPALHRGYSRHAPRVHLCDGRRRARRRAAMLRRRARRRRPRARRHARRGGRGARSSAEAPAAVQAWGAQVCMRSTVGQALVHVPRTSRTWAPCASCPAPRVRAARRRPVRIRHSYGTAAARLRHGVHVNTGQVHRPSLSRRSGRGGNDRPSVWALLVPRTRGGGAGARCSEAVPPDASRRSSRVPPALTGREVLRLRPPAVTGRSAAEAGRAAVVAGRINAVESIGALR